MESGADLQSSAFTSLVIWHCINKFQFRVAAFANKAVLRTFQSSPADVALPLSRSLVMVEDKAGSIKQGKSIIKANFGQGIIS